MGADGGTVARIWPRRDAGKLSIRAPMREGVPGYWMSETMNRWNPGISESLQSSIKVAAPNSCFISTLP